jgi:hypothetical protein
MTVPSPHSVATTHCPFTRAVPGPHAGVVFCGSLSPPQAWNDTIPHSASASRRDEDRSQDVVCMMAFLDRKGFEQNYSTDFFLVMHHRFDQKIMICIKL